MVSFNVGDKVIVDYHTASGPSGKYHGVVTEVMPNGDYRVNMDWLIAVVPASTVTADV